MSADRLRRTRIDARGALAVVLAVADAIRIADREHVAQRDLGVLVLDFHHAAREGAEHREPAVAFDLVVLLEELEEVLVVTHFVRADVVGDFLQHRLVRAFVDRAIERGRARLDDAACDHFERAGFFERLDRAGLRILGKEIRERGIPVELGPHVRDVRLQRAAVLQFFVLPCIVEPCGDFRIVIEEFAQIARIEIRAALDERRRAQQQQQILVRGGTLTIDPVQVDVLDTPRHHMRRFGVHGSALPVVARRPAMPGAQAPADPQAAFYLRL
ncbi:hypothetical protein WQ49_12485 [Burkholderia cenocepacia]|nr:hypothetical protein WQ49_12485 [Burkholderia cenocepacia]